MRVFVAGNRGFIGAHTERTLLRHGHQVVGADRGEVEARLGACRPEAIVWAAGSRHQDTAALGSEHVRAPVRTMHLSHQARFVYLSTGEIYGPQAVPFSERLAPAPVSAYAQAKAAGERALAREAELHRTPLVVLRLPVIYGPGQGGTMFIPALLDHLRRGARFAMTEGRQTRDFLYVEDVAAAVICALSSDSPPGTFNLGSGVETSLIDLARLIAKEVDGDAEQLLDAGALAYRDEEQMRYVLDISLARRVLGFSPKVDLLPGIRRTIAGAAPENPHQPLRSSHRSG